MRRATLLACSLVVAILTTAAAAGAPAMGIGEKAALQAAMQRHIDRQLVDGVYLYLDSETGTVEALHPVVAHPMILRMGERFVLCSDFRDDDGNSVNVDFYLAPRGDSFVVFHAAIDDRELLQRLMRAGGLDVIN